MEHQHFYLSMPLHIYANSLHKDYQEHDVLQEISYTKQQTDNSVAWQLFVFRDGQCKKQELQT